MRVYELTEVDFRGACEIGRRAGQLVDEMRAKGVTMTATAAVQSVESDLKVMRPILERARQRRARKAGQS